MAKTGKQHTIVEDLILSAVTDMVVTMLGEKAKKTIQTMPSSNNTVSQRISDMAEDVLKQIIHRVRASEFYALQLDESTEHEITVHLSELAAQLRRYFPESDSSDSWIRHPFTDVPASLSTSEQESLIEITTDGSLKMEFDQKPLSDFWIGLYTEHPMLAKRAVKTLMPFATRYMCECGFSALTSMKTKYRARLSVENDLRLRLSQIQPDIADLCASSHAHPSH